MTWIEMRKAANHQLLMYRRNSLRLKQYDESTYRYAHVDLPRMTREEAAEAQLWHETIEHVLAALRVQDSVKVRFMVRYFALRVPKNRRFSERARRMQLASELYVSDSTIYKWKEDILQLVIAAAIQSGALRPYPMKND